MNIDRMATFRLTVSETYAREYEVKARSYEEASLALSRGLLEPTKEKMIEQKIVDSVILPPRPNMH